MARLQDFEAEKKR